MGIASLLKLKMLFELIVLLLTNPSAMEIVLITEIHIDGWIDSTDIYRMPIRCEQTPYKVLGTKDKHCRDPKLKASQPRRAQWHV